MIFLEVIAVILIILVIAFIIGLQDYSGDNTKGD